MNVLTAPDYLPEGATPFWAPPDIAHGVAELATQLAERYHDTEPLLVGVMDEAYMVAPDLARSLAGRVRLRLGFVAIANRLQHSEGSANLKVNTGGLPDLRDQDVIFVHARTRSGTTADFLSNVAGSKAARSVIHAALIDQPCPPGRDIMWKPDCVGATIDGPLQLFGYGIGRIGVPKDSLASLDTIYRY